MVIEGEEGKGNEEVFPDGVAGEEEGTEEQQGDKENDERNENKNGNEENLERTKKDDQTIKSGESGAKSHAEAAHSYANDNKEAINELKQAAKVYNDTLRIACKARDKFKSAAIDLDTDDVSQTALIVKLKTYELLELAMDRLDHADANFIKWLSYHKEKGTHVHMFIYAYDTIRYDTIRYIHTYIHAFVHLVPIYVYTYKYACAYIYSYTLTYGCKRCSGAVTTCIAKIS